MVEQIEQTEWIQNQIRNKQTYLGIELGSTRIKTVLVTNDFLPIASGEHEWENKLVEGVWTYSLEEIWQGLQQSYRLMANQVQNKYHIELSEVGAMGFSAMMHGYLAFDKENNLLVPFRTWRNAMTAQAEEQLTEAFQFNIPQRWSIAHLYQAMLNKEEHVGDISFFTTLAGYVHWQLTGEKVLGIVDASGMFPVDSQINDYDKKHLDHFNQLAQQEGYSINLEDLLPRVKVAGQTSGILTQEGAYLLDPSGKLKAGIPLCPPEGDAGTGMVATNSVLPRTGNVSAGTSVFAMIVLEQPLKTVHPEIDIVTTPSGELVAMVHANNCSTEIDAWVKLFKEFTQKLGLEIDTPTIYKTLFNSTREADLDGGGILVYGYHSGENITKTPVGRPLIVRTPDSKLTLGNFMRTQLMTAFGALRIGMTILEQEGVHVDQLVGHGGIFKTPEIAQEILAAAMKSPVTVMETAGEGGAWGMAILAAFQAFKQENPQTTLADFLSNQVFRSDKGQTIKPTAATIQGYDLFIQRYEKGLPIEQLAGELL